MNNTTNGIWYTRTSRLQNHIRNMVLPRISRDFPGVMVTSIYQGLHPFTKRLAKWCDTDAPSPLMTLHSDNAKLLADAVAWYD